MLSWLFHVISLILPKDPPLVVPLGVPPNMGKLTNLTAIDIPSSVLDVQLSKYGAEAQYGPSVAIAASDWGRRTVGGKWLSIPFYSAFVRQ